ncbi:MAG TPA: hypothetical protein GXZ95_02595 [Mollicutes bacterium]|nr:hypothetical protein [Mollicutes bacterium]
MKVMKTIKTIFLGILGIAFFAFVITMTVLLLYRNRYGVTKIGETSLVLIKSDVSHEKYKKGNLVLVEEKTLDGIEIGDEVFAYRLSKEGIVSLDIGIVGEKHPEDAAVSFENGSTYAMQFVAGTPTKVYEKLGTYLGIILSTWGFLFMILVPSFLIFIYEIYALVVEIKYGKDEIEVQQ